MLPRSIARLIRFRNSQRHLDPNFSLGNLAHFRRLIQSHLDHRSLLQRSDLGGGGHHLQVEIE